MGLELFWTMGPTVSNHWHADWVFLGDKIQNIWKAKAGFFPLHICFLPQLLKDCCLLCLSGRHRISWERRAFLFSSKEPSQALRLSLHRQRVFNEGLQEHAKGSLLMLGLAFLCGRDWTEVVSVQTVLCKQQQVALAVNSANAVLTH